MLYNCKYFQNNIAIQMTFGILIYRAKVFLTVIVRIEFSELTKNKL